MKSGLFRLAFPLCALSILPLFFIAGTAASTSAPSQEIEEANAAPEQWLWQHPQPQGDPLRTIDCPTEENCYAASYAMLVQSKDGQKSWSVKKSPGPTVNGIHCPSANVCYAAGSGGHVLKTTNGGASWEVIPTNISDTLWDIYCFNTSNCIVVTSAQSIQQTLNGGDTWLNRATTGGLPLADITCLTASTCLAVGGVGWFGAGEGVVVRSQNGGSSWQIVTTSIGDVLTGIACIDASTCIVVGWNGLIRVSHDAGSSWRHATAHTNSHLRGIVCPTAAKCFIVSQDGKIYHSNDGYIWLDMDVQNDISLASVSCSSPQRCTAVGDNGLLLTTRNGGIDWLPANEGVLTSEQAMTCYQEYCGLEYSNQINDLVCFADGRCLAVGHTGKIYHGDLFNASWSPNELNTSGNLWGLTCVEGATTQTCYIVGDGGGAWKSVHDGVTWQPISTGRAERLFDIDCITSSACVAVGEDGVIVRTVNGGVSWQTPVSPAVSDLLTVACPSSSRCIAVGSKGEAIYTTNGGQNWQQADQPPIFSYNNRLSGIFCQSEFNCIAVGKNFAANPQHALLARTVDGGANWVVEPVYNLRGLNDIKCTPDGLCKAVGESGGILRSEDGGDTWQEELLLGSYNNTLLAISCLDDGSCFTSGWQGAILGASVWPQVTVNHYFSGGTFAHGERLTAHIEVVNQGETLAPQIGVANHLPPALQASGPLTVSWDITSTIIAAPVWPDILSGLHITLTPGAALSIQFPLMVDNPQHAVQTIASQLEVTAVGLPRPIEVEAPIILAERTSFTPFIARAAPYKCHGPYLDDFNSPTSGWPSGDSGNSAYGYAVGEYVILHRQANRWMAVSRGDLWQNDLLVKTSGYQLTNVGLWGLLFGHNGDWSNFYTFEIAPDLQRWYILNFNAAYGWSQIATSNAGYILTGQGKNHLLIQGANNKMYFYVNNYLIYEMAERPGFLGLTGGSFIENTQLRYEYYLFHQRSCSVAAASLVGEDMGFSHSFSDDQKMLEIGGY